MKKLCILISVGVLVLVSCHIAVAQGYFRTLRQPDGKTFQAVERGDQWLRFYETPEGYIVRRGADGYFRYFNINARGDFIATNLKVGINPPVNVAVRPYENPAVLKALNQKIDAYNTAAEANRQRYLQWQRSMLGSTNSLGKSTSDAYTLSSQSQITLNVGVLLVEFNDVQHHGGASGYTVSDFEDMLFSDDFYHTENNEVESPDDEEVFGSLRDYFQFQSHGILQVDGQVINPSSGGQPTWLNMGNSSQYASGGYYDIKDLVPDAINAAINQSWSVNQDPPFLIAIIIAQDPFAQNVGFEWGYAYFQQDPSPYQNFGFDENEFEASFDYDNWLGAYAMHEREDAEYDDPDDSRFAHIGTHCHEMFHVIGWGLPNVLGQGSEIWHDAGPGDWTLTQTAYRTGPQRKAESPGDLDPIARTRLEWADPTDVDTTLLNEPITYVEEDDDVYETFDFYRFYDPYSDDEFFVENRQYSGFNAYLPEWWESGAKGGLLFWWSESSTDDQRSIRPADNASGPSGTGLPFRSDGDRGDPFPGTINNTSITPYTTPNTSTGVHWNGTFTGIAVTDISSSATNMSANLYADFPPAAPQNLVIVNAGSNGQHPVLQWDANTEPDLDYYTIYRGYNEPETG